MRSPRRPASGCASWKPLEGNRGRHAPVAVLRATFDSGRSRAIDGSTCALPQFPLGAFGYTPRLIGALLVTRGVPIAWLRGLVARSRQRSARRST
jgi:hypothetical protein